ncbi:HEAT repeat domain-containing protein [Corallococcus terminator]
MLIFEEKSAEQIEIEPASQEDIEADLDVPLENASAVIEVTRRLVLQVKLHSSAPWSVSEFEQVLKGQDSSGGNRKSALQRLIDDPGHRYVLITDAQLPRALQGFRIESLMAEAPAPLLSKKIRLPTGVERAALSRRIGILDLQHSERVAAQIHTLLAQRLFVPLTRVEVCKERLMERARAKLLNRAPRQWTRGEILQTAESFGGNPMVSSELRTFVPPGNYANLQHRLEIGHALVLQGPPGAGKTQVLEKLKHEYRTRREPFEVPASSSLRTPGELREVLQRAGRIFIAIEDPWGKFQRESGADRWVSDLYSLLKLAGPDKKIVITTREAILHETGKYSTEMVQRFVESLTYEHYDYNARRRIFDNKLASAHPWQRELVIGFEQHILDTLLAPLSIDRFVDKIKGLKRDSDFALTRMLKECSVDHLAHHFIEELQGLGWNETPVSAAIALWGLLSLSQESTFSAEDSTEWRRLLKGCTRAPMPWDKFIQWMVAGSWLTHEMGQYSAHSTTIEGLERLLSDERDHAEEVLEGLLSSLVDAKRLDDGYSLYRRVPEDIIRTPTAIQAAFRDHFRARLVAVDRARFQSMFYIANELCDGEDTPVSLLVDGIAGSMRRRSEQWFTIGSFIPPVWTAAQTALVHISGEAREVATRYIRWLLPFSLHKCAGALASWLWSLGWDLTEDFRRAVHTGLSSPGGADGLGEAIHGFLMGKEPAHEKLLEALLRAWDVADQADENASASIRHKAQQKMTSEFDADVWMDASAEIHVVSDALTAAVMERRHLQGYQWLLAHPRRNALLGYWRSALTAQLPRIIYSELDDEEREDEREQMEQELVERAQIKRAHVQPVTAEELRAFYHCCMPDNAWALWTLVKHFQVPELVPELLETLVAGPPRYMDKCLDALCSLATTNDFPEQLDAALKRASSTRRDAILFLDQMYDWDSVTHSDSAWVVSQALDATLSSPAMPALVACRQVEEKGEPSPVVLAKLAPEHRHALWEWSREMESRLGRVALVVLAALGENVTTEAQMALQSGETPLRMVALKALGWSREPRARASLLRALADEHYECRLLAIRGLTPDANEAERQAITALTQDGSAPVREASVQAILAGRWTEGLQSLCALLFDSRNRNYGESDRNVDHHVARAASSALAAFQPLPMEIVSSLLMFLSDGLTANVDVHVHEQILQLLTPMPLPALPNVLTELLKDLAQNPGKGQAPLRFDGRSQGVNPNVLELRSVAMWSLVEHLEYQPTARATVDLEPLLSMSNHPRERLAIPAWSGLAVIGERAWNACYELLTTREEHTEEQIALLVLISTRFGYRVRQSPIAGLMPEGAPLWKVAEWLALTEPALLLEWNTRWAQAPAVLDWLKALGRGNAWRKYVCAWLGHQFGGPFIESLKSQP